MTKLLVVDDEPKILQAIEEHLTGEGFLVTAVEDSVRAEKLALTEEFNLMILDIMMPGRSGFEVCKHIRQASTLPIILLTARSDELDKLIGLELGADDYITKPFSLRELTARIRTVLRRTMNQPKPDNELIQAGTITLDFQKYEVYLDGTPISFTPSEIKILHLLISNPGQVFSRLQILEQVFGDTYEGYERTIDTHISNIRRKIDPDPAGPSLIRSVYGVGYKFVETRS